ncbi:MAG: RNA polymerase sigma factor [Micromonosporaceae bacterium]
MSEAVAAAQAGSEESFRALYRAVQPALLRYLRTLVGQDAEDVASEAWLQIARDIRTFRGDFDDFRAWTATVARNRAMDHVRKVRRRPADPVPHDELLELAATDDTATRAIDSDDTRTALRLIARLPRDQAEAILLRVVLGLDAKAAGKVLGKRPGAVRTAAYRGLKRLAAILAETPTTPGAPPPIPRQLRQRPRGGQPGQSPPGGPRQSPRGGQSGPGPDRGQTSVNRVADPPGVTQTRGAALREMR